MKAGNRQILLSPECTAVFSVINCAASGIFSAMKHVLLPNENKFVAMLILAICQVDSIGLYRDI
jgi:hypothetical protein